MILRRRRHAATPLRPLYYDTLMSRVSPEPFRGNSDGEPRQIILNKRQISQATPAASLRCFATPQYYHLASSPQQDFRCIEEKDEYNSDCIVIEWFLSYLSRFAPNAPLPPTLQPLQMPPL